MEWLTSNGEIYHRICVYWTAALEAGKCERCGEAIPEPMLRLARSQRADRERIARDRDVRKSLKGLSQRFATIEEKTNATLRSTSSEPSRNDE
jgi:hypothetical protein